VLHLYFVPFIGFQIKYDDDDDDCWYIAVVLRDLNALVNECTTLTTGVQSQKANMNDSRRRSGNHQIEKYD